MKKKKIKFKSYFEDWLYGKNAYYSTYKQIGKQGDFYTSVSTSSFFGGSIANNIIYSIKTSKLSRNTTILEIGGHHGYLLADIIQFIYTLEEELLQTLHFAIVEKFEHLRQQQTKYFKDSFGDKINITFYKDIKEVKLNEAYIVANEIFDAFSCDLVYTKNNILQQAYVENHKIIFEKCDDKKIIKLCDKYSIRKGEISLDYEEFISDIYNNIDKFIFLSFDYGDIYPRNDFSCRVYSKHKVFPIFEDNLALETLYQKSDITYDVNFRYIKDIFESYQNINVEYKTQMSALINFKILDLLEIAKQNTSELVYLKEVQKVKLLIEATGMGDRFKMLKVSKLTLC